MLPPYHQSMSPFQYLILDVSLNKLCSKLTNCSDKTEKPYKVMYFALSRALTPHRLEEVLMGFFHASPDQQNRFIQKVKDNIVVPDENATWLELRDVAFKIQMIYENSYVDFIGPESWEEYKMTKM